MKRIDNRQKQQIQLRAQKAFQGANKPTFFERKETSQTPPPSTEKAAKEKSSEAKEASPEGLVHRTEPKVGRNDPCPCGSGKKYKKCCLK